MARGQRQSRDSLATFQRDLSSIDFDQFELALTDVTLSSGILQQYFGWKAGLYFLIIIPTTLLCSVLRYLRGTNQNKIKQSLIELVMQYFCLLEKMFKNFTLSQLKPLRFSALLIKQHPSRAVTPYSGK
jgi:hypothetical protein